MVIISCFGVLSATMVSLYFWFEGDKGRKKYAEILEGHMKTWADKVVGESQKWNFKPDNAPIHTAHFPRQ